jgi:hypothetical protein
MTQYDKIFRAIDAVVGDIVENEAIMGGCDGKANRDNVVARATIAVLEVIDREAGAPN